MTYSETYGGHAREPSLFGVPIMPEAELEWRRLMEANQTPQDIHHLWEATTTTDPAIRQRLAAVITAPYEHQLPFAMPAAEASLPVYMQSIPDVSLKGLRNHLRERPGLAREMAVGVAYWLNLFTARSPYLQHGESDHYYQRAIYELLPIISRDRILADRLYDHHSSTYLRWEPLQPAFRHIRYEERPRFSPAANMLRDVEMPFEYRVRALDKWQQAALPMDFVDLHRRATFLELTDLMSSWTIDEGFDYTLHARMARFMEERMPPQRPYCKAEYLRDMTEKLLEKDEGLFFAVSQRHMLYKGANPDDPYNFKILTPKDLAFTKCVFDLAQVQNDTVLMNRIEELLDAPEVRELIAKLRETEEQRQPTTSVGNKQLEAIADD